MDKIHLSIVNLPSGETLSRNQHGSEVRRLKPLTVSLPWGRSRVSACLTICASRELYRDAGRNRGPAGWGSSPWAPRLHETKPAKAHWHVLPAGARDREWLLVVVAPAQGRKTHAHGSTPPYGHRPHQWDHGAISSPKPAPIPGFLFAEIGTWGRDAAVFVAPAALRSTMNRPFSAALGRLAVC